MPKDMLKDYIASQEAKKGHVVEVHYDEDGKYQKEAFEGSKLADVVDEAFTFINEVSKDDDKELKFVGFPSDD